MTVCVPAQHLLEDAERGAHVADDLPLPAALAARAGRRAGLSAAALARATVLQAVHLRTESATLATEFSRPQTLSLALTLILKSCAVTASPVSLSCMWLGPHASS